MVVQVVGLRQGLLLACLPPQEAVKSAQRMDEDALGSVWHESCLTVSGAGRCRCCGLRKRIACTRRRRKSRDEATAGCRSAHRTAPFAFWGQSVRVPCAVCAHAAAARHSVSTTTTI
eukprot:2166327-Rhodomonas_salina.1